MFRLGAADGREGHAVHTACIRHIRWRMDIGLGIRLRLELLIRFYSSEVSLVRRTINDWHPSVVSHLVWSVHDNGPSLLR